MKFEKYDCIDSGTEFCPCRLAEQNECILCSQLSGKHFCDCMNWKGTCIYQEFYNNNCKAKEGRKVYNCPIISFDKLEKTLIMIRVNVPHKLAIDLSAVGSFVFLRTSDTDVFLDTPISVSMVDTDKDIITLVIEIRGIKTKKLLEYHEGDLIGIRGPYWNGVFGLKNVNNTMNSNVLVLSRGIGIAPAMEVLKKLKENGNNIRLIIDKSPFADIYMTHYIENLGLTYEECNLIDKGNLTDEVKKIIEDEMKLKNISLLHVAGADILTYDVIQYVDTIDNTLKLSCCNNAKMCCGEGTCGGCTARFKGHQVKRLCKVQTDPRSIFEGRRFI